MWLIIAIIAGIVLLIWGMASYEDSHAAVVQAQAAIEASRATQIAASGQAIVSVLLVVIVLLLIGIIAMAFFLWMRSRQLPVQQYIPSGRQLSTGQPSNEAIQQLQQLLMLQLLSRLVQPNEPVSLPRLPSAELEDSEDLLWWE
jgi:hypothetical protein